MVDKKDEEHRKTTTALLKKTEGVFKHHGHYITQNFDLSSLTGHFLKNIFILFLIKIYGFNYACKSKGIMV